MKIWVSWIFVLICSACSGQSPPAEDPPPDPVDDLESPNDFVYDVITPGGIKIKTNGFPIPALADIDAWFSESQVCIGYATEMRPNVVILEDLDTLCGNGSTGIVCTNYDPPVMGINDAYANFEYQWKHENIHYILFFNDYPDDMNRNHEPEELWDCQFQ